MGHLLEHGVGADDHGAELDHLERFAVEADPFLAVEHRPPAGQFDGQGDQQQQGHAEKQGHTGEDDVERPLLETLGSVVLRLLDVDQGQAGHRTHVQAWAGDVDHTGRDKQGDVEVLQFPRQFPQAAAVELLGGSDGDRVAAGGDDGPGDRLLVSENRNGSEARDADAVAGILPGNAGPDHVVARPGLTGQPEGEVADGLRAADDQQAGDAPAVLLAQPDHDPAGDPSGNQKAQHSQWQCDHQVPAG